MPAKVDVKGEKTTLIAALSMDLAVVACLALGVTYFTRSDPSFRYLLPGLRGSAIDPGEGLEFVHITAWVTGVVSAVAAICLGHLSRWRARQSLRKVEGTGWARWGLILGYGWFVTVAAIRLMTLPDVPYELLLLVGFVGACYLFVRELWNKWWVAMLSAALIAGVTCAFLSYEMGFAWLIGPCGVTILALLPGWVLFHPSVPIGRKVASVAILYFLAAATMWTIWEPLLANLGLR